MNIRTAILSAADSIEQNPQLFCFGDVHIPDDCGTPGCALGWIGHHAGITGLSEIQVPPLLGLHGKWEVEAKVFYGRLDTTSDRWRHSAPHCAKALRLYADKYHPTQGIPDSVIAIFNQRQPSPVVTI